MKIDVPYHESDHVLTLAYSVLCGGTRLEDVDRLRNDVPLLNGLGAALLPDPTTTGNFLRRLTEDDLLALMDTVNSVRPKLWQTRGADLLGEVAFLDADGTIVPPTGVSASRAWASPTKAFEDYPYGTGTSRRNSPYGVIRRPSSVNSNLACDPGPVSLSLVVRGGTVYDGIGAPGVSCDVLIEGDWVV